MILSSWKLLILRVFQSCVCLFHKPFILNGCGFHRDLRRAKAESLAV